MIAPSSPGAVVGADGVLGPPLTTVTGIGTATMAGFLPEVASRFGPREALVFDDPLLDGQTKRWTYADLLLAARMVTAALLADGTEPGDRVGILMGNRPEAVAAVFGVSLAGAVPVMLSTFAPVPELVPMLVRAEVTVVLTQAALLARRFAVELSTVRDQLPSVRTIVAVGDETWDPFLARGDRHVPDDGPAGVPSEVTSEPAAEAGAEPEVEPAAEPAEGLIIFSSGSTASPKGIVHDRRAPVLQFWLQARIFGRHPDTRMWASMPMFWTAGLNSAMGATLAAGGCWVMQEVFEPGAALALMARERVTEPYSLPHQTAALAEHPDWLRTDLSALRCVYGKSAFARHPQVHGDTAWNNPVGYGLSETCAFFSAHDASTPRELLRASYGQLLPGNELRVLDLDTGAPLGPDQQGELAIKGATLFVRYLGREVGEDLDADGFFRTGDVGHYDSDGNLHYGGRLGEMIKTAGANVSPLEVEVQLRSHPAVKVARIIGVPDDLLGEIVVACVTLADDGRGPRGAGADTGPRRASGDELIAFLRERVASYKVPKLVLFFADGEIPMTSSGSKVRDPELAALVADRLATTAAPTSRGET